MYKKILVAVNEHINSEVAGRCALHFSKSCRAKFYTCFIAEKGASEESLTPGSRGHEEALGRGGETGGAGREPDPDG